MPIMGWFGGWERVKRVLYHLLVKGLVAGTVCGFAHLLVLNLLRRKYMSDTLGAAAG